MSSTPYNNSAYNGFVLPDFASYSYACKKKTEMVLRGRVEAAFAQNLVFITLTYDRAHLPTTYKQVRSLPIFSQRETRKKVFKENKLRPKYHYFEYGIPFTNQSYREKEMAGSVIRDAHEWVTHNSRPLNLTNNKYRHSEIMSEQDFKNAKFNFTHSDDPQKDYVGLLLPQDLTDFLQFLRDAIRIEYGSKKLHLRYLANGEYGQTKGCTHRPHYHILIFNHFPAFDFDFFTRSYWDKAKIIQCETVPLFDKNHERINDYAVKRITSYVYAHTAKFDDGNQYQNELSPTFRLMSTYGGGIGYQLCKPELMKTIKDLSLRSLSFSLSSWDKRSSIKFQTRDLDSKSKRVYEYEIPRFFKDKILNYQNLDTRTLHQSMFNSARGLVENFCRYANVFGKFDLLTVFHNLGLCGTPKDVLTFFYINNYQILAKKFGSLQTYSHFCDKFLQGLSDADKVKRQVYRERFAQRKQQKKYDLAARKYQDL